MNAQTDQQLLRDYACHRSEPAFAELVRRHVDLVYSAARRMVADPHQAEDVAQAVFVALSQNAGQLTGHPVLSGWLHRTAHNLAANAVRANVRRQLREQETALMNQLLSDSGSVIPPAWADIAPHLDDALGELTESDRDAVLLRYFEKKSASEMAATLGISDDAAQKRVSRAVDRLREYFAKRGVAIGASGLAVVISANAVQAAPVGLALTISTAAVLTGTTLVTTATVTATKAIAMTTIQKTLVTATVAILAGAGIYEARQAAQLREQVQLLQQHQALPTAQILQLQNERDDATNRLAGLIEENLRLMSDERETELLRLRGEVAVLRRQNSELLTSPQILQAAQLPNTETCSTNIIPRAAWGFAGYDTPAAAVRSMIWAKAAGDFQNFLNSIVPETTNAVINGYRATQSPDIASSKLLQETKNVSSLQILKEIPVDQDTVIVQAMFQMESVTAQPTQDTLHMVLKRTNGEWKYSNEFVTRH